MSALPPILLVDSDADDRELLGLILTGGFGEVEIEEATDAASLARAISAGRFGLVVTEHELPWIRSIDLLRLVRDLRPGCPVIVVTGRPIERVASEVLHLAPDGLLPKTSAGLAALPQVVRAALFHGRRRAGGAEVEAGLRRLLDALPVGVFTASADGTLLDANPALATLLGYERPEQCVQRPVDALFVARAEAEAFRAQLGPPPGTPLEARLRRRDGGIVRARITAWQAPGGGDAAGSIQALVEDRSLASAAEEALAERTAALERSSAELDEMAYVVSHDLRQPLTQIVRYLDLLDRDAGSKLGREPRGALDQARQSATRLEGMVDAVLRLARIESHGEGFEPVELGELLERVLERLSAEIVELGARIESGPLPQVVADETQIEQLFQNLVENALKFRGEEPPRVEISASDDGDAWHLSFRDHGIGLDPKDAERVFVIFQRLHTESEVPGSGIGLALCRRIVTRHGGRIWVESRPGRGATFHVTLPKRGSGRSAQRKEKPS
ncbi:MAG TPA: ATP-binding protein [Thermoanaerobaculia bacterium]|nr:ATP-binding protein [Thermoanaerobaculia bacterium]